MKNVALSILMASMLAACASDQKKQPPETPAVEAPAPQPVEQKAAAPEAPVVDALNDPNSILSKRSVYYPLDVAVVQREDRPLVEAHAQYLASHSGTKVRLEGNCDERGSNEYNLALGQRRADGVKKLLQSGGASASQIESVSNGEEKPKLTCHAEKCWQENRRTDLVYR
ncbi:MAG TPA: peptidoglycan-associated lipoprotein Pal [Gallionellaceae bacterium]